MQDSSVQKKRRIPKACATCRSSKVKCNGGKPCTRCTRAKISCIYQKPPPDPITQKLAQIEEQMLSLTSRVQRSPSTVSNTSSGAVHQSHPSHPEPQPPSQVQQEPQQQQIHITPTFPLTSEAISPGSSRHSHSESQSFSFNSQISNFPPASISNSSVFGAAPQQVGNGPSSYKRKQGDFEVNGEGAGDIIFRGIITYEEAAVYFQAFFQGCHKFVPVFDAEYDTFSSVRARSSMLFTTICAIGCRAENGPTSSQYQILSNATKGPMCGVILGTAPTTIETVQALLVNSCYSEKGWILTSLATRMALDLDLPKAYRDLSTRILEARSRNFDGSMDTSAAEREVEASLFRQARTWFGTFILDHIFSIDCGKKPGIQAKDGMRRCRVLLEHPLISFVDIRLLAQVELNSIRALAHERLSQGANISNQELCDIIQGTRVDISLWLSDWLGIVDRATSDKNERARLKVPLRIQSDWAEMTMLCKGLQGMGIDNVAIMTDEQRNFIHLAKNSAQRHLTTMISDSESYLATFRYGMDFVLAKCAFSVLLLLKLARILPEATNMAQVIADVRILLDELSRARSSHNIYFRILCLSLEKCERALSEDNAQTTAEDQAAAVFSGPYEAVADFQSYVPKEFILEWNFPGLTLCWIPLDFQDMFIDFGTGF